MTKNLRDFGTAAAVWAACAAICPAQQADSSLQHDQPFVEKVEVRVRSVLVFIADAKGKPLAAVPKASDLRATENGAPVEIIAVEPVASEKTAAAREAEPSLPQTPVKTTGVPQYLYLDTTALNVQSMPIVARTVSDNLERLLAVGPLEIVGADPEPRVLLAATRDADSIRSVLEGLPKKLTGKERLLSLRRDTLDGIQSAQERRSGIAETLRAHVGMAIREEIALIRNSLERLEAWADSRGEESAGVLYYCNDGFDVDPTEIYRLAIPRGDNQTRLEVMQLSAEFGGEVSQLLARTEGTLAGKGLTTVPVALGSVLAQFAGNAANLNVRGGAALRRPTEGAPLFFYARPLESLGLVADATGGEVVSATSRLPKVAEHVGGAYLLTFRVRAASDGKPHPFTVAATNGDLHIRAPRYLLTGSPESVSVHRARRVLEEEEKARDLPLAATLVLSGPIEKNRLGGMLRIAANFSGAAELIQNGALLRLRLAMAVSVKGAPTFTNSQEVEWVPDSTSWRYQAPMTWPRGAEKIAIVVEEISTGLAGSAVIEIPKAP